MTGFGKAQGNYKHTTYKVEVRSVNSKQLDLSLRLNSAIHDQEMELRKRLAPQLVRGKVSVLVYTEGVKEEKVLTLNESLFNHYTQMLRSAATSQQLDTSQLLASVLKLPEVLQVQQSEKSQEEIDLVLDLIQQAVAKFQQYRKVEGEQLANDFNTRLNNVSELLTQIEQYEDERLEVVRERLNERIEEIKDAIPVDEGRLEHELVFYSEKFDITEEKVRLAAHVKYFRETMLAEDDAGRKLGFISQEMGREINTLGSKANHSEIQKIVVKMKDELEKIKEQVLNVL